MRETYSLVEQSPSRLENRVSPTRARPHRWTLVQLAADRGRRFQWTNFEYTIEFGETGAQRERETFDELGDDFKCDKREEFFS